MDQHEREAERLRERCLGLPGAREEFPFGDEVSVFKVGGKMFALSHLDGEPITLEGSVPDDMVADLVGDSYDLVVASLPKTHRP